MYVNAYSRSLPYIYVWSAAVSLRLHCQRIRHQLVHTRQAYSLLARFGRLSRNPFFIALRCRHKKESVPMSTPRRLSLPHTKAESCEAENFPDWWCMLCSFLHVHISRIPSPIPFTLLADL